MTAMLVFGISLVTISENPMITIVNETDNNVSISSSRDEDGILETALPFDDILYKQAHENFGFYPPRVVSMIQDMKFDEGFFENDTLFLRFSTEHKYIDYTFSSDSEFNDDDIVYDTISKNDIEIRIFKDNSTFTAVFEYNSHYCTIVSNLNKTQLYNILNSLYIV